MTLIVTSSYKKDPSSVVTDERSIELEKVSNYPHPNIQERSFLSCNNKGVRIKANITTKRVLHNIP